MINLLRELFGFRLILGQFVAGMVTGILLYLAVTRGGPGLKAATRWLTSTWSRLEGGLSSGATDRYRNEIAHAVQSLHAARALFALEQLLVEPRLLAPPPPADPTQLEPAHEDPLSVVPNLPDWNVLAGIYRAPSITLPQAIEPGVGILITGDLGSGKSTALLYLAALAAIRSPRLAGMGDLVPVYLHAADLSPERLSGRDPLSPLVEGAARWVSSSVAQRLPVYLRTALSEKRGLILVDGLDEFPPEGIAGVAAWLTALREAFPGNRLVVAGPARGYDGLLGASLAPIPLAPWSEHEQRKFLQRWAAGWTKSVAPSLPKNRLSDVDPALLNGWLIGALRGLSPLEITLKTWSAYAGDALGPSPIHAYQAHSERLLSQEERQQAQAAAMSWITSRQGAVPERALRRGTPVNDLVEAGILVRRASGRLSFQQPGFAAFLAGTAMAEGSISPEALRRDWLPANMAVMFAAGSMDLKAEAAAILQDVSDPLEEALLECGRWVREAPRKAEWRNDLLRGLAKVLHDPARPYGLRLRTVNAMVYANEASAAVLFRRLLGADSTSSRVLGALGCGGMRDEEAVEGLLRLVNTDRDLVVRQAACLALAAIGTTAALEGLGHALLEGEEPVRLAAAEALACDPDEGYGMLKDAIEVDNVLTRRAAAFGLGRVPEDWALEILDKVQLEDKQWVVRGAAAEALERRRKPANRPHPPVLEPAELPWLVAFAAREGTGVSPGRSSLEILRRALSSGKPEEQIAALEAIAWVGGEEFALDLQRGLRSGDPHLRDATFEAVWRIRATAGAAAVPEPSK